MRVDFAAREDHFVDHLAPVWDALRLAERGRFFVTKDSQRRAGSLGVPGSLQEPTRGDTPVVVASWGDLRRCRAVGRPVILMEHGAGQSYVGAEHLGSYVGSHDRDGVVAVLVPNQRAADVHDAAHPTIPCFIVGCPKLDRLLKIPRPSEPAYAVAHHWDAKLPNTPEGRSAFRHYFRTYHDLASSGPRMIGHAHPRMWPNVKRHYRGAGMDLAQTFDEVVERATVLAVDNSSVLFEFAALDRPVVVLNAPWYRRDVEHGARFWEWADVGIQVNRPEDLRAAYKLAASDPPEIAERRREIVTEVYANLGTAAPAAAGALRTTL